MYITKKSKKQPFLFKQKKCFDKNLVLLIIILDNINEFHNTDRFSFFVKNPIDAGPFQISQILGETRKDIIKLTLII